MPHKTRYEEIAQSAIDAAEHAGGSQVSFCHGLHDIMLTLQARLALARSALESEDRATYAEEGGT